ncbi:MAG: anaerobic ribonucleoside-triphosphate reductase activating protein [Clostridia bacterium]|nr:anaerobic ribonucleoside-triphosphate reductase activating protein [Clostridia bacterium]
MKIRGLQKLTLLDFPGKAGCTVFLGGCNFRCPFCQNSELILPGADSYEISEDEFFSFLKKRSGILDGVCVSGGEPLLNSGVEDFIARIKDMGYLVKLDTNGAFPQKLKALVEKKLIDYVAMDIKNSPEKYALTAGIQNFDMAPIYESVDFLMNGNLDFEFRTTVVKQLHSREDFQKIGEWLKGDEKYFLQQFKDSQFVLEKGLCAYENDELLGLADVARPMIPNIQVRGI